MWTQIRLLLRAVCSGSTLFTSILNLSIILGIFCSRRLQQTTFSDAFFLGTLRVNEQKKEDRLYYIKNDSGKEVCVVFCDISKAFDRVWHKGILHKLACIGISGSLLQWF